MNVNSPPQQDQHTAEFKHPPVQSIEDVIVFKLARLVSINERNGMQWSQQLFDLSLNEWRLLALTQAHAPARAGDLSELMLMDKSQLSRLIKSLTAKDLITSKTERSDARAVSLRLTAKGQTLYHEIISEVLRRNERVLAPLSGLEVQVFNGMLDKLITHNLELLAAQPR